MTVRGCVAHIRSLGNQLPWDGVYNLFASRIAVDRDAFAQRLSLSSLGVTPTNSFLDVSLKTPTPTTSQRSSTLLYGVPVAVKDNFCSDSSKWFLPTTCASRTLEKYNAPYDAAVLNSLLEAGCMLMGKTNMDEFAMGCGSTDGQISGPVINPWSYRQLSSDHTAVIAGGSSGGSAAAIAAGLCVIALGSDTGGSVRLPAAYCGVVGFKPTYGLVSRHGLIPLANSLDVPSVIASCVADIASVLATWVHPIDRSARQLDSTCAPLSETYLNQSSRELTDLACSACTSWNNLRGTRIGIPTEYHAPGLSDEVSQIWDVTAGWLADSELSCQVKTVRLPHTPIATSVYSVLCATEVASNMTRYDGLKYGYRDVASTGGNAEEFNSTESLFASTRSHGFGEVVRSRILAGNFFLLRTQRDRYLDAARRLWRLIIEDFREAFSAVDVLLTPVTLGPAPKLHEFIQLDNRTRTTLDDVCTVSANLAGLPAISIPIALSPSTGLPLGIQLIGPAFSEPRLLQLASFIESRAQFPTLVDTKRLIDAI